MNRNVSPLLVLAAALALSACGDGGGSLATTPKIDPPPPMSWAVQVNSVDQPDGSTISVGHGVEIRGEYAALEDLPGWPEDSGIIAGFLDSNHRSMQPLGGQGAKPVRVGRWGFSFPAFCDLPGKVAFVKVVIGRGGYKWSPGITFNEVLASQEFPVDITCKSRGGA
ncbi:MAG: hypothetical protein AMXMBFR44_2260 [Candidatus Campbellbacteria bacterium]